jgi:hypothetical protein
MPETTTLNGAFPIVPYSKPREAIAWLERVFGAEATAVHPPEPDQPLKHAEVRVGSGLVMINDADRNGASPFALPGPVVVYVVGRRPGWTARHGRCRRRGDRQWTDRSGLRLTRVRRPRSARQYLEFRHLSANRLAPA